MQTRKKMRRAALLWCLLGALLLVSGCCGGGDEDGASGDKSVRGVEEGASQAKEGASHELTKTPPKEGSEAPEASHAVKIQRVFSEEEVQAARVLRGALKEGAFPHKARTDKANALSFLFMAAADEKDDLQAAALQGMAQSWTHASRNERKRLVDRDYRKVVRERLQTENPLVLGRAIEASPNVLAGESPDGKVVELLARIVHEHPEGPARYAALDALSKTRDFQKNRTVVDAFYKALGDEEPYILSTALFRLQFSAYSLLDKEKFAARAKGLLEHQDPGVRGRAIVFVVNAAAPAEKKALGDRAHAMLDDKHPFVRSAAVSAVARLGRTSSIPKLIKMLDDKSKNTYDLRSFDRLTGEKGWVHHDGSAWSRVDDSVLHALKSLSWKMRDHRFNYGKIGFKTVDKDIQAAAKDARAWYKANKKRIPADLAR